MNKENPYPSPTKEAIRRERLLSGMSQKQAARLIYRTKRCWQNWEYGQRAMGAQLWESWQNKAARVKRRQFLPRPVATDPPAPP